MIKSLFTDGIIRESDLNATIKIYVNLIVFYLIMQYLVYYFFLLILALVWYMIRNDLDFEDLEYIEDLEDPEA